MSLLQAPSAVVMIRPHKFLANPQTAGDNVFQAKGGSPSERVAKAAREEFDCAVGKLEEKGVTVHVFDDFGEKETPDSVFPNNWFSTHAGGHIAIYPMFTPNRRKERRWDVIEMLKQEYRVQDVIDYSGLEMDDLSLEGTGAMVLDHIGRIAYTVQSNRADPIILERFCTNFNYEPMVFEARDQSGTAVYHTNVLMTVATDFALICLDMIVDPARRKAVALRLAETGRDVIDLTQKQIVEFAGNAIELTANGNNLLAISKRALDSLTSDQKNRISKHAEILPLSITTIETAGGSVRCTMAGIHLSRRS